MRKWSLALLLMTMCAGALAGDACPRLRAQLQSSDPATRIAAVACNEHAAWFRPFIDRDGRVASSAVSEAEARILADGRERAWQRVARYWQDSGLLRQMTQHAGALDCASAHIGAASSTCRGFVIDNAWSAAFVSWVMQQAALPGFRASARHFDYVRDAYLRPDTSAYRPTDPRNARPTTGDLLCFVRNGSRVLGYEGLRSAAAAGDGLDMHCEVVVATNPDNDSTAYLISGNVQQTVTMRLLPLNRNGEFWSLPQRASGQAACSPDNEAACNFNRQDWAVLLKLRPAAELATLQRAMPLPHPPPMPEQQACCVHCVVGSGVPRCPPTTNSSIPGDAGN